MKPEEDDFVYLPLADALRPGPGKCWHYKDYWWAVDPQRGLMFYRLGGRCAPQCNADESIQRAVAKDYTWAEVVLVPHAFVPLDHDDSPVVPRRPLAPRVPLETLLRLRKRLLDLPIDPSDFAERY